MFKCSSLEGRLIKNLFKAQLPFDKIDVRNREEAEKSGLNKDQIAVIDAIEAAEHRQIIAPSSENPIIRCFKTRCGSRNDIIGPNDFAYFKAKLRLHRELDVTKLVKNLRNIRNMLQFMTTRGERRLNRMQADKNMVIIGMKEKTVLQKFLEGKDVETWKMHEDSSEFGSDDYQEYLEQLADKVDSGLVTFRSREFEMIQGIAFKRSAFIRTKILKAMQAKMLKNFKIGSPKENGSSVADEL